MRRESRLTEVKNVNVIELNWILLLMQWEWSQSDLLLSPWEFLLSLTTLSPRCSWHYSHLPFFCVRCNKGWLVISSSVFWSDKLDDNQKHSKSISSYRLSSYLAHMFLVSHAPVCQNASLCHHSFESYKRSFTGSAILPSSSESVIFQCQLPPAFTDRRKSKFGHVVRLNVLYQHTEFKADQRTHSLAVCRAVASIESLSRVSGDYFSVQYLSFWWS